MTKTPESSAAELLDNAQKDTLRRLQATDGIQMLGSWSLSQFDAVRSLPPGIVRTGTCPWRATLTPAGLELRNRL